VLKKPISPQRSLRQSSSTVMYGRGGCLYRLCPTGIPGLPPASGNRCVHNSESGSDVYGIPSAIGRPGGKCECHSGNVFEGIYSTTQIPEQWSRLLPLAEFTYNVAKHKAIGISLFEADIGYIPRLLLDLLAPGPRTPISRPGTEYAERLVKILRMLREQMEETQLTMVSEANEHRQPHPFQVGDSVFLDTRLLPVSYANVNSTANDNVNSRKFQHPYAGRFTILKSAGGNLFVLDIPAHWRLHPVFNVAHLKLSKVDKTCEHSPPPLLCSTATVEYKVESICQHRGTTVRDLKYLVKWVGYTDSMWEPLANLRGSSNELLGEYHATNGLPVYRWMEWE